MKWVFILIGITYAKYVSTVITLTQDSAWKYVSKFAAHIGTSTWEMKAKFVKSADIDSKSYREFISNVYIDNKWEEALEQDTCQGKETSTRRVQILRVPLNGEWSETIDGTLSQNSRTHFWYFSLSDCSIREREKLRVEMHFYNSDGSEFSAEEYDMEYIYPVIMMIFLVGLSGNIIRLIKKFNKTDNFESNLLVLNIAIGCQFLGLFCEVLHLWVYSYNGRGLVVLDVFYQGLEVLASVIITILLIIIASGWTLKYKDFPDADIYIPISLFVVIINLMIVGLGRITDDSYYKNSDYEGIPGYFLIIVRITM